MCSLHAAPSPLHHLHSLLLLHVLRLGLCGAVPGRSRSHLSAPCSPFPLQIVLTVTSTGGLAFWAAQCPGRLPQLLRSTESEVCAFCCCMGPQHPHVISVFSGKTDIDQALQLGHPELPEPRGGLPGQALLGPLNLNMSNDEHGKTRDVTWLGRSLLPTERDQRALAEAGGASLAERGQPGPGSPAQLHEALFEGSLCTCHSSAVRSLVFC